MIDIIESSQGGLAIDVKWKVSRHEGSYRVKTTNHIIEEEVFPRLNYAGGFMGGLQGDSLIEVSGRFTSILNLTLLTNSVVPFIRVRNGGDVRVLDVSFESEPPIREYYPRRKDFLWLFSNPTTDSLREVNIKSESVRQFESQLPSFVLGRWGDAMTRVYSPDAVEFMLKLALSLLDEFDQLIARVDLREQSLQDFLSRYYFLLSPTQTPRLEKRKLGPYIPDFILTYGYKRCIIIEIKMNNDPLFVGKNPTSALVEACRETKDRFDWISRNESNRLSYTEGLIIIGRREDYLTHRKKVDTLIGSLGYNVKLLTYDDLRPAIENLILILEKRLATSYK